MWTMSLWVKRNAPHARHSPLQIILSVVGFRYTVRGFGAQNPRHPRPEGPNGSGRCCRILQTTTTWLLTCFVCQRNAVESKAMLCVVGPLRLRGKAKHPS